jgi:hypothetical protein
MENADQPGDKSITHLKNIMNKAFSLALPVGGIVLMICREVRTITWK